MNVSQIELSLTPALYDWRTIKERHTTVAVDILRATTAICAAFFAGAKEIVPLDSLEPLEAYHAQGYLRAAERGGKKVDGAECGNSPTEYLTMDLHGHHPAHDLPVQGCRGAARHAVHLQGAQDRTAQRGGGLPRCPEEQPGNDGSGDKA